MNGKTHPFGGDWTTRKLEVLRRYLEAYGQALKATRFRRIYIDAFAGTGYRGGRTPVEPAAPHPVLDFPELAEDEPRALLDGSARISLQVEPAFDQYLFIERDPRRCAALEELKSEFPDRAASITVRRAEANDEIRKLCGLNWQGRRAVLFLDPYGMQVEWSTLQAIAHTRAIDLWLLFPLGIGVSRLLVDEHRMQAGWHHRLTLLFGNEDWKHVLYRPARTADMFGDRREKVALADIAAYFMERLKSVFPGVADNPAVLRNSRGSLLYLLCFAAANPRGAAIALRIAGHLLQDLSESWLTDHQSNGPKAPGTR